MSHFDRRAFLKALSASAVAATLGRGLSFAQSEPPFQFLVVGDSLIWGQGLEEKDKIYSHTAQWLRREAFGRPREVNLKVKAHSGATITFEPKDAAKMGPAGVDENTFYPGEVNVTFPSMMKQVENASAEYRSAGYRRGADLVMLTAGITDLTVEGVLNPFGDDRKLPALIETVCRDRVVKLLDAISTANPDAIIAVVGYFPMISSHSPGGAVFNGWLETLGMPGFLQPMINNPLIRPLIFGRLRKKAIRRSEIWLTESNRNLRLAVEAANTKGKSSRAIFIESPLTREHAAEAPRTVLFRIRSNGTITDPLYENRKAECRTAFADLKRRTGISASPKRCSLAAVGHPDERGSRLYADTVISKLRQLIQTRQES